MNNDTLAAYEAIDHYLDDLLCELPPRATAPPPVEDNQWPPASTDYLVCTAAGMRVAIPMGQIEDILDAPLDDGETLSAGDAAGDRRLQVHDLGRILADDLDEPQANAVVVLNGWRWALACRTTDHEASSMAAADVHWRIARAERRTRPWLGGMHKDGGCAFIDVVMLQDMLDMRRGVV